jgi:hypothetical protein
MGVPDAPKNYVAELIGDDYPKFNLWVGKAAFSKVQFLACISQVSAGLLYGSETLLLITVGTGIFSYFLDGVFPSSYWEWFGITLGLALFSYVAFKTNERRQKRLMKSYFELYLKYKKMNL